MNMTTEKMNEIVNNIMKAAKQSLIQRMAAKMNPIEAMKQTAKELVDFGLPVDKAVVTVKVLLMQIGKELDMPHPYKAAEIEEMKNIIMK
ncbi:hypothetical protein AVV44_gp210 [Cronobacter phage S13]|jgi:hypothetical protein|uniref:Uncharacterized protein n=1 Tax=Cronobacter phage LPCS28 TaxID=2924885 RepID=A0AAE9K6I7_9CAUD|nr:hypothetical protein AVV44_gp210 [Cronobacter phage S13]YP_010665811.1 hypothetical protein PQB73_gp213 [Cronobacter phage LPCS28]AIA65028.1 hypothetical protein S13_231 [Cronobacter phage S13]UNY47000.1 hypothetical protein EHEKIMEA_00118 [Cronobacter phage LPCS28]